MKKKISIVLPVFNEKDNLEKTILSVLSLQKKLPNYFMEVVISDSHSTDGTMEIAKKLNKQNKNVHYIDGKPGIGTGLYNGHLYSVKKLKSDILIQIDADGQADKKVILYLIKAIESGYNLAIGSRFLNGGKNKLSTHRRIFSTCSSLFCRVVLGPFNLHEFTNSTRAFTPDIFMKINWKKIPLQRKTFIAVPAQLNEAIIAGAIWKEVPLIFNNRPSGKSKNKILKYIYDLVIYCFSARIEKWKINLHKYKMSKERNEI